MHRLVIALTTLLTLVGGAIVAGYLVLFSVSADRAASMVPASMPAYVNVFLQPSTGQKMNLQRLLGRLPGFGDQATIDAKIDEVVQQLLSGSGLDYRSDLKPWLGDQLAMAVQPAAGTDQQARTLVVAATRDAAAASDALARLAGGTPSDEAYRGAHIRAGDRLAYAVLSDDRFALIASDAETVKRALDARDGAVASLGRERAFTTAMQDLPADHLASAFVNVAEMSAQSSQPPGVGPGLAGFSTLGLAVVAESEGLHVIGKAPFDQAVADASMRAGFALAGEPSSLTSWMPATTQAEVVVFGLRQTLQRAEAALGQQSGTQDVATALTQIRAVTALGLGINVDEDLLPLLDREAAVALTDASGASPHGQLLLRPTDPEAASAALKRMHDALVSRGASERTTTVAGATVTSLQVPQVGEVSWAMDQGVVILALDPDDVAAALTAHEQGSSLATSRAYRAAFDAAGARAGNEAFVSVAAMSGTVAQALGLSAEGRDMLSHVTGVAITAPAHDNRFEFHAVATIE